MDVQRPRIPKGRILWRFFTGAHMDGKKRQRGRRGAVSPLYRNYFWNRYSRPRRAAWRNGIFWSLVLIAYGMTQDSGATIYGILAVTPFLGLWVSRKLLIIFTQVNRFTNSDGVPETYRSLRPKYSRRVWAIKAKIRFRVHQPLVETITDPTERAAILALNAEEHGEPITALGRPMAGMAELITTEGAPKGERRWKNRGPNGRKRVGP